MSSNGDFDGNGAASGAMSGAASGAMVGSVVPGVGTAIGAGVGLVAGGLMGGFMGGGGNKAAQRAAEERQRVAQMQRAEAIGEAKRSGSTVRDLAQASPQELATMERGLSAGMQQLDQRKRLLEAVDPSIMEASKQILGILRGDQTGGAMSSFGQQRDMQRQQLLNRIRQRFGPGGESTAAGMKMLSDFDAQMNAAGVGVAQGQLQSLTGLAGSLNQMPGELGVMGLQNTALAGTFKNRMLDAEKYAGSSMLNAMNGTAQNVYDSAGASQLGGILQGRQNQQNFNQLMQTGATFAGAMYGGGNQKAVKEPGVSNYYYNGGSGDQAPMQIGGVASKQYRMPG